MAIDYSDARFQEVENQKQNALNQVNNTYNDMINKTDSYYQNLQNQNQAWANEQQQYQKELGDIQVQRLENQQEWAKQDYLKEQKGAYADYVKASDRFGGNAELMASNGLKNTGYSMSNQVAMYNAYQNRLATARDSFNRANQEYDLSISEAMKTNNYKIAEIAANAYAKQLELALQGFQYKNTLLLGQLEAQQGVDNTYYSRRQDVVNQINTENSLAEQKRQFNASMSSKSAAIQKSGGGSSSDAINSKMKLSDPTEYEQSYDPMTKYGLSLKATSWYLKDFNKHSYKYKDLNYVLKNAVKDGKITDEDAVKIYNSYGIYA